MYHISIILQDQGLLIVNSKYMLLEVLKVQKIQGNKYQNDNLFHHVSPVSNIMVPNALFI